MSTQKIAAAVAAVLLVSGAIAVFVATRPSDEELLRQAVARHVSTLKDVKDFALHGTVADVAHADGRVAFLAFQKNKDGEWVYAADLQAEFDKAMKDPAVQAEIVERFVQRLAQRYRATIEFSKEFSKFEFSLRRDREGPAGVCRIGFTYPKIGDRQPRGQYLETFRWMDGRWRSEGAGSLYDYAGK